MSRGMTDTSPRDVRQKYKIQPLRFIVYISLIFGSLMVLAFNVGRK